MSGMIFTRDFGIYNNVKLTNVSGMISNSESKHSIISKFTHVPGTVLIIDILPEKRCSATSVGGIEVMFVLPVHDKCVNDVSVSGIS